jgi:hypothetical protein
MGKKARSQIEDRSGSSGYFLRKSPAGIIGACGIIIFLITVVMYAPVLNNDFVNFDDNEYVFKNNYIRSLDLHALRWMLTAFHASNWHPLTWLSHAADYAVWGLNPFGHHVTNIILHGLNTFLVFLLVVQLMPATRKIAAFSASSPRFLPSPVQSLIAAGVTALLFGIHPLHVESVAWVAERKDLLCAFFFLVTLCSYLFYTASADTKSRWAWFAVCVVLSAAALMAKPMAVTLPLVMLLLDIYPLQRIAFSEGAHRTLRLLLEKIPFFLLSAVSIILTVMAQHAGGAFKTLERIPLHSRLLNALHSVFFYLTKMLWPVKLVPFYPFPATVHYFDPAYAISGILAVSVSAGCLWLWKRGNRLPGTAWAYYLITLLPVAGIVQVGGQAAADRYTYLPSLSIFLLAGLGFAHMVGGRDRRKRMVMSGGLLALIIVILFAQLTVQQVKVWQDSETLWKYFITSFPGRMYRAHYDLGNIYYERGMFYEAITEYENAIAIHPNFPEAHNSLGNAYYKISNYSDAALHFEKALALGHKVDLNLLELVKHNQPYF